MQCSTLMPPDSFARQKQAHNRPGPDVYGKYIQFIHTATPFAIIRFLRSVFLPWYPHRGTQRGHGAW